MATYQDGSVRKATPNSVTAARRSATNRQCPECGRKSALVRVTDIRMTVCKWTAEQNSAGDKMCGYSFEWDGS